MNTYKIALASCDELRPEECDDDILVSAFKDSECDVQIVSWKADIDWTLFDAVLIRTTWDYTESLLEFLSWIDRVSKLTHIFNPPETIHWNSRKNYLCDLGWELLPTRWFEQHDSFELATLEAGLKYFMKPQIGANASGTCWFYPERSEDAQLMFDKLVQETPMMIQPYNESVETFGEVSAIFIDGVYAHGVRKIPVPGDYRVQDDHGASDQPYDFEEQDIKDMGHMCAEHPEWLYARFDFLKHEGRLVLNELELIEPSLFFRHGQKSADLLVKALLIRLANLH